MRIIPIHFKNENQDIDTWLLFASKSCEYGVKIDGNFEKFTQLISGFPTQFGNKLVTLCAKYIQLNEDTYTFTNANMQQLLYTIEYIKKQEYGRIYEQFDQCTAINIDSHVFTSVQILKENEVLCVGDSETCHVNFVNKIVTIHEQEDYSITLTSMEATQLLHMLHRF
jgi:hypothetical protein